MTWPFVIKLTNNFSRIDFLLNWITLTMHSDTKILGTYGKNEDFLFLFLPLSISETTQITDKLTVISSKKYDLPRSNKQVGTYPEQTVHCEIKLKVEHVLRKSRLNCTVPSVRSAGPQYSSFRNVRCAFMPILYRCISFYLFRANIHI